MSQENSADQRQSTDFDVLLGRAERLLESSELEAALQELLVLQEKYVAATRVFDLIGEAYMRGLDFKQGIRYKTLHEVLSSTLSAQGLGRPLGGERTTRVRASEGSAAEEDSDSSSAPAGSPPTTHLTAAMGHELSRQGHYAKALEIFEALLQRKPEDETLVEARETTRKKLRERKLLGVLERWLTNIEDMKANRASEHD
jgi:uncharacterized protein HemY